MKGREPYRSHAIEYVKTASEALTKAVGAMILGFPGPLHAEAIRMSIMVDELLEAMEEERC